MHHTAGRDRKVLKNVRWLPVMYGFSVIDSIRSYTAALKTFP